MKRIEFMAQLASLLQDIPVEERKEAMKYYNDYFDDAGIEDEDQIISELESPQKVAAIIKEGLACEEEDAGVFTETGYYETKFEQKEVPVTRKDNSYQRTEQQSTDNQSEEFQKQPRTSKALKVILIIAIILVGTPIVLPIAGGILLAVLGCLFAVFAVFAALVIASVAVVISGVAIFVIGIINLVPELAIGLALVGIGLILFVLGLIASVASVRLCIVVYPGIVRGIVWLCRRPFQRKAVA